MDEDISNKTKPLRLRFIDGIVIILLVICILLLIHNARVWKTEGTQCLARLPTYYQEKVNEANPGAICKLVAQCEKPAAWKLAGSYITDVDLRVNASELFG